jgi:cytochrome c-type biogenesis protein CcmE
MTEAWKRRLFALVALTIAGGALGFVSMSDMEDDLTYYWSPTELMAAENARDATVRLGGMVVAGSVDWDREGSHVSFKVTDGATTVDVDVDGNPPQMFKEGIGVVVEGKLGGDDVFSSDRVMVKHSNEYQAPEGEDYMASWKQSIAEGD